MVSVKSSFSWLFRYIVSTVGILMSICGYAALVPNAVIALATVVPAFSLCVHFSKNRLLLLVSAVMLYASYSIAFVNYVTPLTTSLFTTYRDSEAAGIALSSLLLFLSCLLLFAPREVRRFSKGDALLETPKWNTTLVVAICIVLFLILIFGFGRPDAMGGDRGSPSAIYEYSMIFFLIGFYFSGERKSLRIVLCVLAGLFALQNIIYGGRVTALQLLLVLFFECMSKKVSARQFMALAVFGLITFTFLGSVRTGLASAGIEDFVEALRESFIKGFSWDTAYSSWHTSITFLLYGSSISPNEHLGLLWQWIQSIFLGGGIPMSNLAQVTLGYYYHYYGGILPIFFHFYLGPLGVVLIAGYVSIIFRLVNNVCTGLEGSTEGIIGPSMRICALYVSVSCFRWILYSPSQITRGLMLCFLCSAFLIWLNHQMTDRSSADRISPSAPGGGSRYV